MSFPITQSIALIAIPLIAAGLARMLMSFVAAAHGDERRDGPDAAALTGEEIEHQRQQRPRASI